MIIKNKKYLIKNIQYILGVFAFSVVAVTVSFTQTHAIDSYGVGAIPAFPRKDNPRTQSIFIYQLEPGKGASDGIRVVNNSDVKKTIAVYPVDSESSSDGAFACKQQVEPKKNVGSWLQLAKTELVLDAHTEEIIPFTINIPSNADVGEHNGCIAIQDQRKNEATGNGIVLSFRSALRVAVMVPGDVRASLAVKEFNVSATADKVLASPLLRNSGNVSIDTQLDIKMKNMFGRKVGESSGKFPILRDTSSRFNIEFETPFWGGWYTVEGAAYFQQLQTTGKENASSQPVKLPARTIFVMPEPKALAIQIGVVIAILAVVGFGIWRVLRSRQMHLRAFTYEIVEGDDIQTLAERHATTWKRIAQLNSLKPPYHLQPGTKLKIPGKRRKTKPRKSSRK